MSEEKKLSLEEAFVELDEVIKQLQQPETTLEDSFTAYKKGMDLVKDCNDMIDKVEKQVLVLSEGGNLDEF